MLRLFLLPTILLVGLCFAGTDSLRSDGIPIARIGESIICCPLDTIELDGWASIDIGGEVQVWYWSIGAEREHSALSGEARIIAPEKPGTYQVILKVADNQGNISPPDTGTLHVMHAPPKVTLRSDTTVKIGVRIDFSPEVVSHCSKVVSFEWDFNNDGTFEYRSGWHGRTSRTYNRPGRYRARFRVVDDLGREAGGIRTITITGSHRE
jgi:PKD repeat protein